MKKLLWVFIGLVLGISQGLWAGPFTISGVKCTTDNNSGACTAALSLIEAQLKNVEAEINKGLPDVDATRYANGMANSLALSSKGLGVDYASNISWFVVGGGLGLGFDPGDKGISSAMSDPAAVAGIAASVSGMAGFNLGLLPLPEFGPIDPKKAIVFVNFAAMDIPSSIAKELSGSFNTFGINARYKFIDKISLFAGLAEWSGVDFITGLNYSSMKLQLQADLDQNFDEDLGGGEKLQGTYKTTATFGPDSSVFTIPVEASTGVRFLYVFRLYGGLGVDFNVGSSEIIAKAPGTLDATFKSIAGVGDDVTADTKLDLGGTGSPDLFGLRAFGGLQLDFSVVNIFLQANTSVAAGTYGFSTGARAFW